MAQLLQNSYVTTLMNLLTPSIMLQAWDGLALDNSLCKCQMLKISSGWAQVTIHPGNFPKDMKSFHGHSWFDAGRLWNSSSDTVEPGASSAVLLEGIWASPSLSYCQSSFSLFCNEYKLTYFLFSWGNESEAKKHWFPQRKACVTA